MKTVIFNQDARNTLEGKHREIAIIAALVAMGDKGRPLFASHVMAALDMGARRQEIVEVIGTRPSAPARRPP